MKHQEQFSDTPVTHLPFVMKHAHCSRPFLNSLITFLSYSEPSQWWQFCISCQCQGGSKLATNFFNAMVISRSTCDFEEIINRTLSTLSDVKQNRVYLWWFCWMYVLAFFSLQTNIPILVVIDFERMNMLMGKSNCFGHHSMLLCTIRKEASLQFVTNQRMILSSFWVASLLHESKRKLCLPK